MSGTLAQSYITKIEGHGRLKYCCKENIVQIEIDEGERLFEKLVLGQSYLDVPFIVARICGVCPTSHALGSIRAIESAFEVEPNDAINDLRRALQGAQIVQSHALHLFLLALPDYLKVASGLDLYDKNPHAFKVATKIKSLADEVIEVIGGRAVHPVTPTVGGFLSVPSRKKIEELIKKVRGTMPQALETLEMFAGFRYPYLKRPTEYFTLVKNGTVDILGDTIFSSGGVEAEAESYPFIIKERVKSYSTAKFAEHDGHGFMVGALARVNLMEEKDFNPKTRSALRGLDIKIPFFNGYKNNLAQAIEVLHFLEEVEISLTNYLHGRSSRTKVSYKIKAGVGTAGIEAPRGTLYHSYKFDEKGVVVDCDIITPTVQNLTNLEDDANEYLRQNKQVSIVRRERELEMLVRAYDPCITCSVH
jgi:sulfhydrogenase subunit alpha